MAALLILVKVYAWISTGSLGVLAALVDSLLDLFASLINMLAVRYAMMPADDDHRYGHGKAEALAGLAQAAFISSSALFLIIFTVERLAHPNPISSIDTGTGIIIFSILITTALVLFQNHVVSRTGSVAIKADSLHYRADLLTNTGILAGLLLYLWGWTSADTIIALLIGIYILECAIKIGYESTQLLLDRELPEAEQQQILKIAQKESSVIEVHGLRTRLSGQTRFVQMHLVLKDDPSLSQAHEISERVEIALKETFDDIDIIIHQDPESEMLGHKHR